MLFGYQTNASVTTSKAKERKTNGYGNTGNQNGRHNIKKKTLALILLFYFWGFQLIILACLLPYILHNNTYGNIVEDAGVSRTWWGFFTSNVAFMDVGFTLTPDSMISFQKSQFVLMIMWFFIIIGNTGFPVMLRFLIWITAKVVPRGSGVWEELRFLLDHPRRCFTLLFPSGPNWWLFWILVVLNALDLLFFLVLDVSRASCCSQPEGTFVTRRSSAPSP